MGTLLSEEQPIISNWTGMRFGNLMNKYRLSRQNSILSSQRNGHVGSLTDLCVEYDPSEWSAFGMREYEELGETWSI